MATECRVVLRGGLAAGVQSVQLSRCLEPADVSSASGRVSRGVGRRPPAPIHISSRTNCTALRAELSERDLRKSLVEIGSARISRRSGVPPVRSRDSPRLSSRAPDQLWHRLRHEGVIQDRHASALPVARHHSGGEARVECAQYPSDAGQSLQGHTCII